MRRAYYDTYDYPSYWKGRDYEHESEILALDTLLKNIPDVEAIADIGAGFGRLANVYLTKSKKCYLVEPSENLLDVARENLKQHNGRVSYICCGIENTCEHLPKNSLDVALMVRVMHHLKEPKEVVSNLNTMLKKNGYVILEFANKIHGKALVRSLFKGDFTFPIDITPNDVRCDINKNDSTIPFYNYHPDTIFEALREGGFKVKKTLSVSNVRNEFLKKKLPFSVLLKIESQLQKRLSGVYFGPSIFVLAQKVS